MLGLSIPVAAIVAAVGHALFDEHHGVSIGVSVLLMGAGVSGVLVQALDEGLTKSDTPFWITVILFTGAVGLGVSELVAKPYIWYRAKRDVRRAARSLDVSLPRKSQ